jgi:hypothetical protein
MTERAPSVAGQDVSPRAWGAGGPLAWLVGPVTRFELVRSSRRGGFHLLRLVFLLSLLLFLWFSYQACVSRWEAMWV